MNITCPLCKAPIRLYTGEFGDVVDEHVVPKAERPRVWKLTPHDEKNICPLSGLTPEEIQDDFNLAIEPEKPQLLCPACNQDIDVRTVCGDKVLACHPMPREICPGSGLTEELLQKNFPPPEPDDRPKALMEAKMGLTACKDCDWCWKACNCCLHGHKSRMAFNPHHGTYERISDSKCVTPGRDYHRRTDHGYNTDGHCPHYKPRKEKTI